MLLNGMEKEWDVDAITEYCQRINGIDLGQGTSSLPVPEEMLLGVDNTLSNTVTHCYSSPK